MGLKLGKVLGSVVTTIGVSRQVCSRLGADNTKYCRGVKNIQTVMEIGSALCDQSKYKKSDICKIIKGVDTKGKGR